MKNNKIIEDFINEAPAWLASMSKMHIEKHCPVCGLIPENMAKLVEAVKGLREKAWKYDELSK